MGMAITMFIAFIFLMTWVPAHWKRRVVGYGLLADISVHVVPRPCSEATQKAVQGCCWPV